MRILNRVQKQAVPINIGGRQTDCLTVRYEIKCPTIAKEYSEVLCGFGSGEYGVISFLTGPTTWPHHDKGLKAGSWALKGFGLQIFTNLAGRPVSPLGLSQLLHCFQLETSVFSLLRSNQPLELRSTEPQSRREKSLFLSETYVFMYIHVCTCTAAVPSCISARLRYGKVDLRVT